MADIDIKKQLARLVAKGVYRDWMKEKAQGLTAEQFRQVFPGIRPWKELGKDAKEGLLRRSAEVVDVVDRMFGVGDAVDGLGNATRQGVVTAVRDNAGFGIQRDRVASDVFSRVRGALIGENVWSGIASLRQEKKNREEFCGRLNLDPDSLEGRALYRFGKKMVKMVPEELLEVINRAVELFRKVADVAPLKDFRQDVLDLRASFQKSFNEHRGEPGFEKTQEEADRTLKDVMKQGGFLDSLDFGRLGREGVSMLRDAYVGILKGRGEDPKVIASLSPEEAKRQKAKEMYSRLSAQPGQEVRGPKVR